jgi:hypothetical protein
MSTNYGTYIQPEKITTRKKGTVIWPAMFFGGFKLQPEKIMTRKNKGTVVWPTVEIVSKYEHQLLQNWKKLQPKKKGQSSGHWLEHKTQNTTHTDTTTNRMSHATLPSSGFAPSHSMGRAVAPPTHGTAAPQRHAQAARCQGCTCCRWFACLGRQNKRHRIIERGGCLGLRWPPFYQYKQQ